MTTLRQIFLIAISNKPFFGFTCNVHGQLNANCHRPSDTSSRIQILRDGFDSRLELMAFEKYSGGCQLQKRKLTSQCHPISVEFGAKYLIISSVLYHALLYKLHLHMPVHGTKQDIKHIHNSVDKNNAQFCLFKKKKKKQF